jgi:hypothetical protein
LKQFFGPLRVFKPQGGAVVVPEIKLSQIAVKMLFLAMLVYTFHTTFEDGKEALNGVGMNIWISQGFRKGFRYDRD